MFVLVDLMTDYGPEGDNGSSYVDDVYGPFNTYEEAHIEEKRLRKKRIYCTVHEVKQSSIY